MKKLIKNALQRLGIVKAEEQAEGSSFETKAAAFQAEAAPILNLINELKQETNRNVQTADIVQEAVDFMAKATEELERAHDDVRGSNEYLSAQKASLKQAFDAFAARLDEIGQPESAAAMRTTQENFSKKFKPN